MSLLGQPKQKKTGWQSRGSEKEILKENPPQLYSDYDRARGATTEQERKEKTTRCKVHFSAPREMFIKRRKEMGNTHGTSTKEGVEDSKDVRSVREEGKDLVRLECDIGVQAVTETITLETQTPTYRKIDACLQANPEIVDARLQPGKEDPHMPKPMKKFLDKVMPRTLHYLTLNDRVPIHGDDYLRLTDEDTFVASREDNFLREAGNFSHMHSKGRHLTSIDWRTGAKSIVCFSCIAPVSVPERADMQRLCESSVALVWNFADPMHPMCLLESPAEVLVIKFNPARPHLVVGGCINGQVVVWDITHAVESKPKQHKNLRAPQVQQEDLLHIPKMQPPLKGHSLEKDGDAVVSRLQPIQLSRAEFGHKRAVHDICWLPESMEADFSGRLEAGVDSNQFATISEDGYMMIWDLRPERLPPEKLRKIKQSGKGPTGGKGTGPEEILWVPLSKHQLSRPDGSGEALGLRLHLEGRVNGVPSYKMCCTTIEGEFCVCHFGPKDEKANQPQGYNEENTRKAQGLIRSLAVAHAGPGWSVQRHPQLPDYYLTVGDWGFKIWKQGLTSPVVCSPQGESQMLCGRWSPTRASVVVIGTSDGFIQIWDMLDRSHEPTLVHRLSSDSISVVEFKPMGERKVTNTSVNQLLVVGTKVGTFHLFDLPKVLVKGQTHELRQMRQLLEREVRRVAYFSWRWRERQKEMDRQVQEKAETTQAAPLKKDGKSGLDDDLGEEDADYMYDPEADAAFQAKVEEFGKEEEDTFDADDDE